MLNVIQDKTELTRRGFVTNYPLFRYWRREAAEEGVNAQPLNVYIHTPYCIQRCAYCHYKTTTLRENQKAQIDRYVDSLCQEIALGAEHFHLDERPVTTLYFGGGTPTVLSGENIDKIMETVHRHLNVVEEPEITFEGEPVTLTERKAEILARHGVNRISIGIQSFCEDVVFKTGRRDTEEQAHQSIEVAKAMDAVVNIDLISGLAGDTFDTWDYSVQKALTTGAHSLTVYKLEVYANTDYFAELKEQGLSLPDDEEELRFVEHAMESFEAQGYLPVNFFTFTRGGDYVQRHTTSKWLGDDTYAFGVSAFGALGDWAYQNTNDLERYSALVEAGELPIFRGYKYRALDLMARDVILGMKLIDLDHQRFKKRYGLDLLQLAAPGVESLQENGFVTVDDQHISLTRKGILYGDYAGRVLCDALEQQSAA